MNSSLWDIFRFFLFRYRTETFGIFLGMLIASISEGVGIMSLVLVVQIMLDTDMSETPAPLRAIFDVFSMAGMTPTFVSLILTVAGLIVFKAILLICAESYALRVNARIASDLRLELVENVVSADWQFFTSHRLGRLSNALHEEVAQAAGMYLVFCRSASHVVSLFIYVLVAAGLSWSLSLAAIVSSLVLLRLMKKFVDMSARSGSQQMGANKEMMSIFSEGLIGMKMLKVMGVEQKLVSNLKLEVASLMKAYFSNGLAKIMTKHAREPFMLALIAIASIVYVNIKGSLSGVDIGVLVGMVVIFQRAVNAAGHLQQQYQSLVSRRPFYESLMEVNGSAISNREALGSTGESTLIGSIKVEGVHFSYANAHEALQEINLSLPAGSLTVLVGESGSGKTTLADTICGLYLPNKGTIYIGDEALDRSNIRSWRRQLGYVEQEPFLFHDSIRNNIFLEGNLESDDRRLDILSKARCDRFIDELPLGIDTIVGERGSRLSGGQKQRIAIARALAREPKLMVLDEATNGLDEETEREILNTLMDLKGEVTMLFLTHRKLVLEIADQVVELKNGKIIKP
jgi:ATP-binding cassette subfamily C protein